MAEPLSQVVASMPRGRFLALMALFLGPAVAVYTLFSIYPLLATMGLSTYTSDNAGEYRFVGLTNFVTLLTDAVWSKPFWNATKNNLIFFAVHMLVQNPIGIALAGLLSLPGLKLRGLYRTIIFLPTMLSVVIVGFSWNLILSPLWGVAEGALKAVGWKLVRAVARPALDGAGDAGADLRLAVRRHSAHADLCGPAQHPG